MYEFSNPPIQPPGAEEPEEEEEEREAARVQHIVDQETVL